MDQCPEGFSEILGSFIDEIEIAANEISSTLDAIGGIGDLGAVSDAQEAAEALGVSLY